MPHRWNAAARDRRRQIESGTDHTFCRVFQPLFRQVLGRLAPCSVLEVGCGTGHLSLMAASLKCATTALEPSLGMHAEALEVLRGSSVALLNVRAEEFTEGHFDVVLSHLCAQTVADLVPFLVACARRLKTEGRFVFSVPHPCFYNDYKKLIPVAEYAYSREIHTEVSFAITAEPSIVFEGVPYHHRPLASYFTALREAGLAVRDFLEPWPAPEVEELYGRPWVSPRYCVFVCVLSSA